jgi:type VI secretion system protein ImpA
MTLPENILSRIPGENPSGQNLRWEPIYERVKEARREEDDLPQGEWAYKVKAADPALVIRLATDALCTKTKDLQLAAWLTEALILEDGVLGLKAGLELLHGMIEHFWDTLYPEREDGDLELRAAPLNWVGFSLADQIKKIPITRVGYDWFKYQESRSVGYEDACAGNESRMKARQTAISEKKLTPEAFDQDADLTPREFYAGLSGQIAAVLPTLDALDTLCTEKFKSDRPSFGPLRNALDDLQLLVGSLLKSKGEEPERSAEPLQATAQEPPVRASVAQPPARKQTISEEPADREDALRRINGALSYLRRVDPSNPEPYLALRGLRWGALLAKNSTAAVDLESPASENRQKLKILARERNWAELLEASESALASPSGAAWLDLQRYSIKACQELGSEYESAARGIQSIFGALLAELPGLPQAAFADDTAVASAETLEWLKENFSSGRPAAEDTAQLEPLPVPAPAARSENQSPDASELAMRAARSGRVQEAIEILTREIGQEASGRRRFERKTQLANVCLAAGQESIAYPILKELAQEIESRKLAEWETAAALTSPLTALLRCINKLGGDARERQEIYERICRLDPIQALACQK